MSATEHLHSVLAIGSRVAIDPELDPLVEAVTYLLAAEERREIEASKEFFLRQAIAGVRRPPDEPFPPRSTKEKFMTEAETEIAHVDSTSDDRTVNNPPPGGNIMRHAYRVLSDEEKAQMQAIKDAGLAFHTLIEGIGQSREISLAKTKTEEAVMWAVKHITR